MTKNVKIIGVPLDLGAEKLGVDMGPSAIRYAGLTDALKLNQIDYIDCGDLTISKTNSLSTVQVIQEISEKLSDLVFTSLEEDFTPIILGGDHSVSIGSIAGAAKHAKNLGVIWFDYHPDANTPETSPSGNVHGMPVAISLGYGYDELVTCGGFTPKLKPENICIVGAHDIDNGEKAFLENLGVKMFTLFDIDNFGIYRIMDEVIGLLANCDKVHISFDVDVLDPLIAPGTGILSKGGLTYREASYVMEVLAKNNVLDSIDIIEVNPLMDIKNSTAELAVELLISGIGGSFGDYERNYLLKQRNI